MAKRFALSPIVGDGLTTNTGFRAAIIPLPWTTAVSIIPTDAQGQPLFLRTLCALNTHNLPQVLAVTNVLVFPDYPLDAALSGMEAQTLADLRQNLAAHDLDGNGLHFDLSGITDDHSYRALILALAQQLDPGIAHINNLDAPEPTE